MTTKAFLGFLLVQKDPAEFRNDAVDISHVQSKGNSFFLVCQIGS